jgi:beta-lactamase regulating signal transducer with metallopeptidase domain
LVVIHPIDPVQLRFSNSSAFISVHLRLKKPFFPERRPIMPSQFFAELADRLCLVLLHSLWQSALLSLVAVAATRWLHRGRVEAAYRWHAAALVGCLIALPLTFAWLAPNVPGVAGAPLQTLSVTPTVAAAPQLSPPTPIVVPAATPPPTDVGGSWGTSASWRAAAPSIAALYFLGVAAMFARLLRGLVATERLRRTARPIPNSPATLALRDLALRFQLRTVPLLAETSRIIVPTVVGFTKPMVLLPTATLTGLAPAELELILAHELAHLRRGDLWMQLVQRIAEAVLFFNPALWYLSRRASTLREECCDNAACGLAGEPNDAARLTYATALVRVVELVNPSLRSQAAATVSLAATGRGPSELRRRIARLVGEPVREPVRVSWGAMAVLFGALLLALIAPNWDLRGDEPNGKTDSNMNVRDSLDLLGKERGESYRDRDFIGVQLGGGFKSFSAADFTNALLANAKLKGDTSFQEAKFEKSNLCGATLTSKSAGFQIASFDRADASRITIEADGAAFQGASFRGANLNDAKIRGTDGSFQSAVFDSADLSGATIWCGGLAFQCASLSDTNLCGADLSSFNLNNLDSCEFDPKLPPKYSASTKFPKWFDPFKAGWRLVSQVTAVAPTPSPNYVIAQHVILREGREIVTWEEIREQLKAMKEKTPEVKPQFNFTEGARSVEMYEAAQLRIRELNLELRFTILSLRVLGPGESWRYDQIQTPADLVPDESLGVSGTVVDHQGNPVANAAVIMVTPVDDSIPHKAHGIAIVEGRVRNEVDHVMTYSSDRGEFALYPPKNVKGYFLAIHPTAGFELTRINNFGERKNKLNLYQWAGLNCQLPEELEPRQEIMLRTFIDADDGTGEYPKLTLNQHWSDRAESRRNANGSQFNYAQVPPMFETRIERNFSDPDGGGSTSVTEMTISFSAGEVRELKLGPPTPQQLEYVSTMRKKFDEANPTAADGTSSHPRKRRP